MGRRLLWKKNQKHLLRRSNVADAGEKLLEIGASASSFETIIVHREPLDDVLLDSFSRPHSKPSAPNAVHSVSDRNDRIQIEVFHLIGFAVRGSCCILCNNCRPIKLAALEDILQVAADTGFIDSEEIGHLRKAQP